MDLRGWGEEHESRALSPDQDHFYFLFAYNMTIQGLDKSAKNVAFIQRQKSPIVVQVP